MARKTVRSATKPGKTIWPFSLGGKPGVMLQVATGFGFGNVGDDIFPGLLSQVKKQPGILLMSEASCTKAQASTPNSAPPLPRNTLLVDVLGLADARAPM